jgi:DNA-binding NarL/FixJ family response regulator
MTNDRRIDDLRKLMKDPFLRGRGLTMRQAEVARLAAFGYTTDEIADELEISRAGAGSHMANVKKRTGLGKFGLTRDLVKQIQEMLK